MYRQTIKTMESEYTIEQALAFAKTLKSKSTSEAVGQLCIAFNMDVASAKALLLIVEKQTATPTKKSL